MTPSPVASAASEWQLWVEAPRSGARVGMSGIGAPLPLARLSAKGGLPPDAVDRWRCLEGRLRGQIRSMVRTRAKLTAPIRPSRDADQTTDPANKLTLSVPS
jgi:hypothetical protein